MSTCPICFSHKIKMVVQTKKLDIFLCTNCHVFFANHKKTILQSKDYYETFETTQYNSYYKPFRTTIFRKNWQEISQWKDHGVAIDIGGAFGWFADQAPRSWKTMILEPSRKAIKYAKKQHKKAIQGNIDILSQYANTFDLITLWNVFEHLPKPNKSLITIHTALQKNGILALSVPNRKGLINRFAYFFYHVTNGFIQFPLYILFQVGSPNPHLFHYSVENIEQLLHKKNFTILKIDQQPIIDVSIVKKRIQLEKSYIRFFSIPISIGLYVLNSISILLKCQDELIIYAQKK